jgi:S-adenosylmethionine synthetase
VEVTVNAADDPAAGSVYLTVTGTSAEGIDEAAIRRLVTRRLRALGR